MNKFIRVESVSVAQNKCYRVEHLRKLTMAQEGHSPVLVFDSPVMVLHSLVLGFTQSSFNFYRV